MLPADHEEVIGWHFVSNDGKFWRCSNYEKLGGYWMVEIENPKNKRPIPPESIGKTYKRISPHGNSDFGFYIKYASPKREN